MITDEILEAYDMLVEKLEGCEAARVATALREMLCDFDESRWLRANAQERKDWLAQFLI